MTEKDLETHSPRTPCRSSRWPGIIWAIPLAAILIVGYLGIEAIAHRRTVITVTFDRAADVHAGDSKVLYEGAEVGQLIKLLPNKDGHRVDFRLRMISQVRVSSLNTNARFWLIGATPSISAAGSLKAVVSGVAIGYQPGVGGTPTKHFEGVAKAPLVFPGDRGKYITLTSRTLGSIREGSDVLYHGQSVGKVTDVKFVDTASFRLNLFIFQPYDSLIKPESRFWKISPLRVSLAGGGANVDLAPVNTLLSGGIEMDSAELDGSSPDAAANNSDYILYPSRDSARQALSGPAFRYDFVFSADCAGIGTETPVTLRGFQIGEVERADLSYDQRSGRPLTAVTALIYPNKLALGDSRNSNLMNLQNATQNRIATLVRVGYEGKIQQTPPLVGNRSIALAAVKGSASRRLDMTGTNPRIPTTDSGDAEDIMAQTDTFSQKSTECRLRRLAAICTT